MRSFHTTRQLKTKLKSAFNPVQPPNTHEHAEKDAEPGEEHKAPAHAPVVASDENVAIRRVLRQNDKRSVANSEFLVKLHLRAQFVCGLKNAPVGKAHLQLLGTEFDEPMQLQSRIVGLYNLRPHRPHPVVRKAPRPGDKEKRRAAKRENGGGDGVPHS